MTKTTMYRYLGRNGIITTRVHLDGISFIPMVTLKAALPTGICTMTTTLSPR